MGQPVLTATLALAIAVVLTAATAFATLALGSLSRAIKLTVVGAVVALAVVALARANVRINFTGSMPIGAYLLSPLPSHALKPGMLVASCAPSRAASLGWLRGYLASGPCPDDTELLLKSVAAVTGDDVGVTAVGIKINGCLLPHSRPAMRDHSGRALAPWPQGHYTLAADQVWLYAANDRSWDSRYWGPTSLADIAAEAVPLLLPRGLLRSANARPDFGVAQAVRSAPRPDQCAMTSRKACGSDRHHHASLSKPICPPSLSRGAE